MVEGRLLGGANIVGRRGFGEGNDEAPLPIGFGRGAVVTTTLP